MVYSVIYGTHPGFLSCSYLLLMPQFLAPVLEPEDGHANQSSLQKFPSPFGRLDFLLKAVLFLSVMKSDP